MEWVVYDLIIVNFSEILNLADNHFVQQQKNEIKYCANFKWITTHILELLLFFCNIQDTHQIWHEGTSQDCVLQRTQILCYEHTVWPVTSHLIWHSLTLGEILWVANHHICQIKEWKCPLYHSVQEPIHDDTVFCPRQEKNVKGAY